MLKTIFRRAALAAFAVCLPAGAFAQALASKPISIVIPFAAGGPTDSIGRTLAQAMTTARGQTVLVENRAGAGGTVASGLVARAQPDGHTLLLHHIGMSTAPGLYRKLAFNPLQDFEFIGQIADVPMTVIGRADLPATSQQEFVAYMKKGGKNINLAHAGLGAASQLCGMLLQQALGTEVTTIAYQGTAPAITALMGSQVDVMCDQTVQTLPYIKANKVKMFGVTTPERLKAIAQAPTLREAGLKDFSVVVWHGLYAPKGTPAPVLEQLNQLLRTALKDPQLVKRLDDLGVQIVAPNLQTPEGLRNHLSQEIARWTPLIRAAGTYAD